MIRLLFAFLGVTLASSATASVTVTSTAAGFAGTFTTLCNADAGNTEIDILYNAFACQRQGVVEFDVSAAGLTAVTSALLTIFDGAVGNSEAWGWPIDLYGYAGDNQVTGGDFNLGTYVGTVTWQRYDPQAAEFTIDLTNFVNGQLALGTPIVGINLRANGEYVCQSCATAFIYFDGAGGDRPPTLSLQPVPIPGAAWLFGSGLALLRRSRRRSVCR